MGLKISSQKKLHQQRHIFRKLRGRLLKQMECKVRSVGVRREDSTGVRPWKNLVYQAKKYGTYVGEHLCVKPLWAAAGMG